MKIKKILLLIIGIVIGISTTVTAATVFNSKDITYSSSATTKTNVKDSLDELYTKANTPWSCATGWYCYKQFCPDGYVCLKPNLSVFLKVNIGDYIKMTPQVQVIHLQQV